MPRKTPLRFVKVVCFVTGTVAVACSLASCDASPNRTDELSPAQVSVPAEPEADPSTETDLTAAINLFMARLQLSFPDTYRAVMLEARSEHSTRVEAFSGGQALLSDFSNDHAEDLRRAQPEALRVLADRIASALEGLQREDTGLCAQVFRSAPNPSAALALSERSKTLVALAAIARLDAIVSATESRTLHPRVTEGEWEAVFVAIPMRSLEVIAAEPGAQFGDEQICEAEVDLWTAIAAAPSPLRERAVADQLAPRALPFGQ